MQVDYDLHLSLNAASNTYPFCFEVSGVETAVVARALRQGVSFTQGQLKTLWTWIAESVPVDVGSMNPVDGVLLFYFEDAIDRSNAKKSMGQAKETMEDQLMKKMAANGLMESVLDVAKQDDPDNHKEWVPLEKASKKQKVKDIEGKLLVARQIGERRLAELEERRAKKKRSAKAKAKSRIRRLAGGAFKARPRATGIPKHAQRQASQQIDQATASTSPPSSANQQLERPLLAAQPSGSGPDLPAREEQPHHDISQPETQTASAEARVDDAPIRTPKQPYMLRGPRQGQLIDTPLEVNALTHRDCKVRLDSKSLRWLGIGMDKQSRSFGFGPRSSHTWQTALEAAVAYTWYKVPDAIREQKPSRQVVHQTIAKIAGAMQDLPDRPHKYPKS